MEFFHPGGQHLCKFIGTKANLYIRRRLISHRIGLKHQSSCRFIKKKTDFIGETQLLVNKSFSLWWPKANQLAIYENDRGAELGTTENKSSSRFVRALNPGPPDYKPILLIVLGYLHIWTTWRLVKPLHNGALRLRATPRAIIASTRP